MSRGRYPCAVDSIPVFGGITQARRTGLDPATRGSEGPAVQSVNQVRRPAAPEPAIRIRPKASVSPQARLVGLHKVSRGDIIHVPERCDYRVSPGPWIQV